MGKTKRCSKCKVKKPFAHFHKNKSKLDGHTNLCKKCANPESNQRYYKNHGKNLLKDREYYKKNKEKIDKRAREYYQKNKEKIYQRVKKYKKKYSMRPEVKEKSKVRAQTRYAIKMGKLVKKPCEICQEKKTVAHHPDYSEVLKVVWLCKKHHIELHSALKILRLAQNSRLNPPQV